MALGLGEEFEILLKAILGFLFSENGFSEEVEVYRGAFCEVVGEGFFLAGEDDALAVFADLCGDSRHDDGRKEAGSEDPDSHEGAFVRAKVFGDAVGFDESAEGGGLGGSTGRAKDFVGEMEGEFLAIGVGKEAGHFCGFLLLDGSAGCGEELGGEFAGLVDELRRRETGRELSG